MTTGHFQFSTDILRRLGEELNPSPDQGILELVKNSYDADATFCSVELFNVDQPAGSVRVHDDGAGMDSDAIIQGWLVIGRSPKVLAQKTPLGRVPTGSKGLGRLAALRMGSSVTLVTRPRFEPDQQYEVEIDWSKYERTEVVEDIQLEIRKVRRPNGMGHGTDILLKHLRSKISYSDAKKLARALLLLAHPFDDNPIGFRPTLTAPDFTDLERLVRNRYFTDADYHLAAVLNLQGRARVAVLDWKGKELFQGEHSDIAKHRGDASYEVPPANFDLWAFILTSDSFRTRQSTLSEVRTWLGQFGGVHVYHNDIRVAPYGNVGNDWLEMNLRRARSPEERPSTNTSIGRVSIDDPDGSMLQKTDRSGFIEGRAFDELRAFAQDSLEWMARCRMQEAERRRADQRVTTISRTEKAKKSVQEAIQSIPSKVRRPVEQAFNSYDRNREREANALKREVQLYRTLSTAGITAATFAHESAGNAIKVITNSIRAIERRARNALGQAYADLLQKPVDGIANAIASLSVLGTATMRLLQHEKRRASRVDIHDVIIRTIETLDPFLKNTHIEVIPRFCSGSPYLRTTEAAIESIITNLLNNSVVALEESKKDSRKIVVSTHLDNGTAVIQVADNGPGIEGISVRDVWLPGETTRPNGTGLGLTIVRDTARDMGGNAEAIEHGSLGGAEFNVTLPILGYK